MPSQTLSKVEFSNLASMVQTINSNFAVIENSPLFKGIQGEEGGQGLQGNQGLRGTQIFTVSREIFNNIFSTNYIDDFSITVINNALIDEVVRLYQVMNVTDSLIDGDMIILDVDLKMYRYYQESNTFISTGIILIGQSLQQYVTNQISQIAQQLEAQISSLDINPVFQYYETWITNALTGNGSYQEGDSNTIFLPKALPFGMKSILTTDQNYHHSYFGLNDNKTSNGSDKYKTTTVIGSLATYQQTLRDSLSSLNPGQTTTNLPILGHLPCIVLQQNDFESGILLGRNDVLNNTLENFGSIFMNNSHELIIRSSFYTNIDSNVDNPHFAQIKIKGNLGTPISEISINTNCKIVSSQDIESVNFRSSFMDSNDDRNWETSSIGYHNDKYRLTLKYRGNNTASGYNNSELVIDFKDVKLNSPIQNYYNNKILSTDSEGYLKDFKSYRNSWLSFPNNFTGLHTYISQLSNDNIVTTEKSLSYVCKYLWGNSINLGTQNFPRNFENVVFRTDLARRDNNSIFKDVDTAYNPISSLKINEIFGIGTKLQGYENKYLDYPLLVLKSLTSQTYNQVIIGDLIDFNPTNQVEQNISSRTDITLNWHNLILKKFGYGNVLVTGDNGVVSSDYLMDVTPDQTFNIVLQNVPTSFNQTSSLSIETLTNQSNILTVNPEKKFLNGKHFHFIMKMFDKFLGYIKQVKDTSIPTSKSQFLVPAGTIISWYPCKTFTNDSNQRIFIPAGWVPAVGGKIYESTSQIDLNEDLSNKNSVVKQYDVPDLTNRFVLGHRPYSINPATISMDFSITTDVGPNSTLENIIGDQGNYYMGLMRGYLNNSGNGHISNRYIGLPSFQSEFQYTGTTIENILSNNNPTNSKSLRLRNLLRYFNYNNMVKMIRSSENVFNIADGTIPRALLGSLPLNSDNLKSSINQFKIASSHNATNHNEPITISPKTLTVSVPSIQLLQLYKLDEMVSSRNYLYFVPDKFDDSLTNVGYNHNSILLNVNYDNEDEEEGGTTGNTAS